ncbi:MAG: YjbH domain-containing protein [Bacteroides sp.]
MKKKINKIALLLVMLAGMPWCARAQQYTGMTGLIQVPSAEMNEKSTARIGAHFLNKAFSPSSFRHNGKKYHTISHYLNLTPFSWIEMAYTCTFFRTQQKGSERVGFYQKDRYFSIKVRPLEEGKWWPAIALGSNDPYSATQKSSDAGCMHFTNYYLAASKHLLWRGDEWGVHLSYRYFRKEFNSDWNGVVGGLTYRPRFAPTLRLIAEYTGKDCNVGADCLLWKHLLVQASLQDGKHFTGGMAFQIRLK